MPDHNVKERSVLDVRTRVPEHVIFRSFVHETVALNLETGRFHGLNATAGRMVELVGRSRRPRDAVAELAREYGVPEAHIERDLTALLLLLLERGLIADVDA